MLVIVKDSYFGNQIMKIVKWAKRDLCHAAALQCGEEINNFKCVYLDDDVAIIVRSVRGKFLKTVEITQVKH